MIELINSFPVYEKFAQGFSGDGAFKSVMQFKNEMASLKNAEAKSQVVKMYADMFW